jgi:ferric-dicitrate binding protein FerR (iron transport regulator)
VRLDPSVIRNGTEVDTRKGKVEITTSTGEKATFFDGIFKVSQKARLTTLTLTEKLDCAKRALTAAKKPKTRKLWGDGKGRFRTKGTYSAATVRGTRWLVRDTCTSTKTTVRVGSVSVRDDVKKKTFIVRKGKSYTARARR